MVEIVRPHRRKLLLGQRSVRQPRAGAGTGRKRGSPLRVRELKGIHTEIGQGGVTLRRRLRSFHESLGRGMTAQELVKRRWFWTVWFRRCDCEKQISDLGCRGNREAVEQFTTDVGLRAIREVNFTAMPRGLAPGSGVWDEPGVRSRQRKRMVAGTGVFFFCR